MKRMNNLSEMRRGQQQQGRDKSGHGNSGTGSFVILSVAKDLET